MVSGPDSSESLLSDVPVLWARLVVSGPYGSDSLVGDVPVHQQRAYVCGPGCSLASST